MGDQPELQDLGPSRRGGNNQRAAPLFVEGFCTSDTDFGVLLDSL